MGEENICLEGILQDEDFNSYPLGFSFPLTIHALNGQKDCFVGFPDFSWERWSPLIIPARVVFVLALQQYISWINNNARHLFCTAAF